MQAHAYPTYEARDSGESRFIRSKKDIFYSVTDQLPIPPSTSQNRRNMDLWCEYHKEHDHTLSQCRELKKVLDKLADEGKLDRYLKRDNSQPRGRMDDNRQKNVRRSDGNKQ